MEMSDCTEGGSPGKDKRPATPDSEEVAPDSADVETSKCPLEPTGWTWRPAEEST